MRWYIGYDGRESLAYQVMRYSMLRRSPRGALGIHPIRHRELRQNGLFWREWEVRADGQTIDRADGRPFSTEFSHSRFVTPFLARAQGATTGWVWFADCDFLFLADPRELASIVMDAGPNDYAVACVKHQYDPQLDGQKMDGVVQQTYSRKLWSSLFGFNLDHPANRGLTLSHVNEAPGSWLHAFGWLDEVCPDAADRLILGLPVTWNWVPGLNREGGEAHPDHVRAVHYSFGGPWMGYAEGRWASRWRCEYADYLDAESRALRERPATAEIVC